MRNSLAFNAGGRLVFSRPEQGAPRHLSGVSKERALELWLKLATGLLDELEQEPWQAGSRPKPGKPLT